MPSGRSSAAIYLTALALALPRAEKADPSAQTLIAEIYAKGLGVAENVARASSWYQLAAKNGDRMAAFELGLLYLNGDGVPKNRQKAAELFQQAADKGYGPAQYNLALAPRGRRGCVAEPCRCGQSDEIGGGLRAA